MCNEFIKVYWPDIQDYMGHPRYKECYLCESLDEDSNEVSVYMVPIDLYNEVEAEKVPREVTFEGETFSTFWKDVYRGDLVLIIAADTGEWKIMKAAVTSKAPLFGPILFEDDHFIPGINCKILGVKHKTE